MKNNRNIFKDKLYLLDEPEVDQLLNYCENLENELIDLKFEQKNNKQNIMLDMIKEILKACNEFEKQQQESVRFGLESPDFETGISNLKHYIVSTCRNHKIWL
jgi:hypothetical protein